MRPKANVWRRSERCDTLQKQKGKRQNHQKQLRTESFTLAACDERCRGGGRGGGARPTITPAFSETVVAPCCHTVVTDVGILDRQVQIKALSSPKRLSMSSRGGNIGQRRPSDLGPVCEGRRTRHSRVPRCGRRATRAD